MKPALIEISAPGCRPAGVLRASFDVEPESKRREKIEKQELALLNGLDALEGSTKERNKEFYRQLGDIEDQGRDWQAKLRTEVQEQKESYESILDFFSTKLVETLDQEKSALMALMDEFHQKKVPPQKKRMADNTDEVEVFVNETIPAVIDQQSGDLRRRLKKENDTFDIENAKVLKREQKIIQRFHRHVERTTQAFEDERATRVSTTYRLEEEICDTQRLDDRQEEQQIKEVIFGNLKIRDMLRSEEEKREKEDNTIVNTMILAQKKLQVQILKSFGPAGSLDAGTEQE